MKWISFILSNLHSFTFNICLSGLFVRKRHTLCGRREAVLLASLLLIFASARATHAEGIDQAERARLHTAFKRLKAAYSQAAGSLAFTNETDFSYLAQKKGIPVQKIVRIDPKTNERIPLSSSVVPTQRYAIDFAIQGDWRRLRVKRLERLSLSDQDTDAPSLQSTPPRDDLDDYASCTGPRYRFRVHWPHETGKPVVTSLESEKSATNNAESISTKNYLEDGLFAPVVLFNIDLSEVLADPKFVFTVPESIMHHNHACSKYHFTYEKQMAATVRNPAMIGKVAGWFIACPQENYAVHEAMLDSLTGKTKMTMSINYQGNSAGVPLPPPRKNRPSGGDPESL